MAVIAFILIFLCPLADSTPDNWIIDNSTNSVYVDDSKVFISVSPHTLKESGDIIIDLKSKIYTGNIDVIFGFNTSNVKPTKASRYDPVSKIYTDVSTSFEKVNYDFSGMNTWYYRKNIPVVAGTSYKLKVNLQIPYLSNSGKYWIAIKPSTETIAQSITNGHLYYLDPWWDSSWNYKIDNTITDGVRPYQISLNISNSIGTNNATHVYCGGHCNVNFTDIRFTLDNNTLLPYWIEDNSSTGKVWVNVTANGTVNMYYGNTNAVSTSNGTNTFIQFHGSTTLTAGQSFHDSNIISLPVVYEALVNQSGTNGDFGLSDTTMYNSNSAVNLNVPADGATNNYLMGWKGGASTAGNPKSTTMTQNVNHRLKIIATSTLISGISDTTTLSTVATNIPIVPLGLYMHTAVGGISQSWSFARNYTSIEPQWSTWQNETAGPIVSYGNNYTNNNTTSFTLDSNKAISFNITLRYPGDGINWFVNGVNQSNHYNNQSVLINTVGINNITAQVSNVSLTQSISWYVTLNIQLITPINGSTVYGPYPPSAPEVSFTWSSTGYPFYHLLISTDPYFNYLVTSNYYSSETANVYLLGDTKYYWKVQTYLDALTPGSYSSASWFTLTSNYSVSGLTGIAGTVYEIRDDGAIMPLSDAVVYIRNEALNWSSSASTGVNGYYLFDNLTNNTVYSLNAKATGYEDSQTEYVTTIPGQQVIKNIMLAKCVSGFNCFYNQQYVKFKVQTLFGTKYPGVAISVYKGTELTASDTGTTGTDGSATFLLIKDQQYRITFVSAAFGINREITIIPINTEYMIIITALDTDWEEYNTSIKDTIFMDVSKTIIDDDDANIKVDYLDMLGETTAVTVYLNQTNVSDPHNQTIIDSWTTTGNGTHNFSISPYSGQQYLIHFKAAHSTYGNLEKTYSIFFEKVAGIPGIPVIALAWFAIICVVLTAAAFTKSTAELGAILACGEAWLFLMLGYLAPIGNTTTIATGLTLASVVSVLAYLSMKNKEAGYS